MLPPQSVVAPSGERLRGKDRHGVYDPCLSASKWFVCHARRYTSALLFLAKEIHTRINPSSHKHATVNIKYTQET